MFAGAIARQRTGDAPRTAISRGNRFRWKKRNGVSVEKKDGAVVAEVVAGVVVALLRRRLHLPRTESAVFPV